MANFAYDIIKSVKGTSMKSLVPAADAQLGVGAGG